MRPLPDRLELTARTVFPTRKRIPVCMTLALQLTTVRTGQVGNGRELVTKIQRKLREPRHQTDKTC